MTGILLGSCVGGYMNQYYHPKWTFLLYSAIGASVAISGCTLSSEIDKEGIENCGSFFQNLKSSLRLMTKIVHIPVVMRMILFMFLSGLLSPAFEEFSFYYTSDVRGITKM